MLSAPEHGGDLAVTRTFDTNRGEAKLTEELGVIESKGQKYRKQYMEHWSATKGEGSMVWPLPPDPKNPGELYNVVVVREGNVTFTGHFNAEGRTILRIHVEGNGERMQVWSVNGNQVELRTYELKAPIVEANGKKERKGDEALGSFIPRNTQKLTAAEVRRAELLAEQTILVAGRKEAFAPAKGMAYKSAGGTP
jgi:hypothetical protein